TARPSTPATPHPRAVRFAIAILRNRSSALAACAPLHTRALVTVNAQHGRSFPWLTPSCRPRILDDVGAVRLSVSRPRNGIIRARDNRACPHDDQSESPPAHGFVGGMRERTVRGGISSAA